MGRSLNATVPLMLADAMIISVGKPWGKVSRGTKPRTHPRREMSPYRVSAAANRE